jgi:hypothetical protein
MANLQSFTFSEGAAFSVTHGDAPPDRREPTSLEPCGIRGLAANAMDQGTHHITNLRMDAAGDWPAITTEAIRVGTISATRPPSGQIQFVLQGYGTPKKDREL